MKTQPSYLGIDVSKKSLHLASPEKFLQEFPNTVTGIEGLIQFLRSFEGAMLVLEASGGYERLACELLQDNGRAVAVVQPGCVRHFAKSIKVLAKTDKLDARVIARFGQATQPSKTPKTPENVRKIRALSDRRRQVVEDRVRETNRLEACADPEMIQILQDSIQRLQQDEKSLDEQINSLLQSDTELNRKSQIMTQQKGIGEKTASVLLAQFPELGSLTRQQAAALAGLAPHARESGAWKGKRKIYGGRAEVRKAMYMAARTAARWCPVISNFYNRLRNAGKSYKQAIIACARKMLVRLNTLLKQYQSPTQIEAAAT
jgi:transposase